jgi:glycerol kinase
MGLDNLTEGVSNLVQTTIGAIKDNPVTSAVAVGGVALGAAGVAGLVVSSRKKKRVSKNRSSRKRGRRIKHTRRGWKQDRKRRSKQKWEVAYQRRKRKSKSKRGIKYTKKGQPYRIMASGRARFIKKSKGGKR